MNATIQDPQQHIFHDIPSKADQDAVDALVAHHRGNAALTQQLAIDASRLVSTSQARLDKQANAGFCRRLVSTISGATRQNGLSNQVDMLQMQKVAWHFLQQLQQQNLINAQSIAVIRNNLGTMNEYIIETRDFLELAIDKINSRLRHVENNTRFSTWSLNIEANARRYKSLPSSLLVVQLSYDFLRTHSDVSLTFQDVNHLVVTLEKLGVNCDEEVRLLDFIIALIDQMDATGIERYRSHIALSADDLAIDSAFIQTSVSGLGFNALYYLSDQYTKIAALIEDNELCNSDAAREKIISRIFGDEFDGLATTYTLRDLIAEVVGGGLLAIDLFKDKHQIAAEPTLLLGQTADEEVSLVSELPDITVHSYLDSTTDADDRRDYIRLLSLCLENPGDLGPLGREFITQLATKAGCHDALGQFMSGARTVQLQSEQLQRLQLLLSDSNITYCWLLDAFFLLTIEQKRIGNPLLMRIISSLKPAEFKDRFDALQQVIQETEPDRLLTACASLSRITKGWANILRYRELRFEDTFAKSISQLGEASWAATRLGFEFSGVSRKAMDYSYFLDASPFDEGLLSKLGSAVGSTAFLVGRKSALTSLNQLRVKVRDLIETKSSILREANGLVSSFRMPTFDFKDETGIEEFDLDNSTSNEDWSDQFEHHQGRLERSLGSFSSACDDAQSQLRLFASGQFGNSIVETRAQERREAQLRKAEEDLAKRSVSLDIKGQTQLFSIQWKDLEGIPFDPESIHNIQSDGRSWLISTDKGTYFVSSDRINWQEVYPFGSEEQRARHIAVIDGVWILLSHTGGFHYSHDAVNWKQTQFPDNGDDWSFSQTEDIVHLDSVWIWRFTRRRDYRHTEKGLFFDSEKTSSYTESVLYSVDELGGAWSLWDGAPRVGEGVNIDSVRRIPGVNSLLVFCSYDWSYVANKKKTDTEPFVQYYTPGKGWRNCTWGGDKRHGAGALVTRMGQQLMCFGSNELLTSEKGYEWKLEEVRISVRECFHLDGMSIFPSWSRHNGLHLSQDGRQFKELTLEDGTWNYFCANDQGALSVYSPNAHETSLRVGNFVFHATS